VTVIFEIEYFWMSTEGPSPQLVLNAGPVEDALLHEVDIASFQDHEESEKDEQEAPVAYEELDGPGIEECHFQVEDQEQHGNHVILNRITFVGSAGNVCDTAFVGGTLNFGIFDLTGVEQPVGQQQNGGDNESQDHQNGHSKSSIKDFNVRHSGFKDSKKVFSRKTRICKLYLHS